MLARIIAYYPFFLAGYCIDPSDIASKLRKTKVRIVFLIFSIFFVSGVWIEIKKLYWLAPLLSGQNSYDSLGKMADWGGILRTIYYLIAFALIFALVALAPARKSIISQLGSRSVWVYALHYGAVYLYFGKLGGMEYRPIWIVLVALLVTIICALPFWGRLLGGMIRPKWEQ